MPDLSGSLLRHFGFSAFREGQEAVIRALLDGHSALALFPTGAGKSLCYQLPAVLSEGTALVVSPLISLMKDQVEALRRRNIPAARFDSTLSPEESQQILADLAASRLKLLYISPERLTNEAFSQRLRKARISLFAIDEAHCISEWGHNFRPEYLRLASVSRTLNLQPVLALTATATPEVAADIRGAFDIAPEHHVQTTFHRPNLHLRISPATTSARLDALAKRLTDSRVLPSIVYVTLQETAEFVATRLQKLGIPARAYHAGLPDEQRAEAQDAFMSGTCPVMVATIAFGMGIDKADIRAVFHYNLPKTLENYLQEIGRAGRDGQPSLCEMFACADDCVTLENFTYGDTPTMAAVRQVLDFLLRQGREFDLSRYELSRNTDIRPLVIETILTHLELAGILQPVAAFYTSYQIEMRRDQDRILAGHTPERQQFLRGLFASGKKGTRYLTVDLQSAATALDEPRERILKALNWLEESGDIRLKPTGLRHSFRIVAEAVPDPAKLAEKLAADFQERERRDIARLQEVLDFAAQPACSTQWLLQRFGETLPQTCGHCENCRSPRSLSLTIPRTAAAAISMEDLAVVRSLLSERHAALRTPRQLARFLCGLTSPATTRDRLTRHDAFGLCSGVPFREVLAQMESMIL